MITIVNKNVGGYGLIDTVVSKNQYSNLWDG